jgi:hypothetical protein
MKKIILIICTPLFLFSQEKLENTRIFNNQFLWHTNLLFESDGLNKGFLNAMLYGGLITDSLKDNWINLGDDNNVFYSEISNGFSFKNTKYNIGVSAYDRNLINASFSDDLMKLGFYGNFNYQNETLDFSNTNIRIDRFQQYKIDYTFNFNSASINVGASFLAGNHHATLIVNNGTLFTDTNGIRLDVAYDVHAFITDTSSLDPFARNGNGLALDLSTDFIVKNHKINLYLQDAGFIMWNRKSTTLITDSNFSSSGAVITDIMSFNDSLLDEYNSVEELKTENKSVKTYIPANFGFSAMRPSTSEYFETISVGLNMKWQPYYDNSPLSFSKIGQGIKESNYEPLYWVSAVSKLKYFDALPTLSFGGYSNDFNIGLALSKVKKHRFTIGTQHLEDLLARDKAKSMSVYFNFLLQF